MGGYVENSYGLNPGYLGTVSCYEDSTGFNSNNSMVMLPDPVNKSQFHLFHINHELTPETAFWADMLHTSVDISGNAGEGTTLYKNQTIVDDTISGDKMHTVRHANGRDWWIVFPKLASNKYYIILLTPSGTTITEQSIGEATWSGAGGELVFSPDGTKLARFNPRDDLRIFDFDRCTGVLSNPVYIPVEDNADNELFGGLAFSADGRYLYASEVKRILQFDMQAADIGSSKSVVAERVSSPDCSLGSSIIFLELAPDGRIYCRPGAGQRCMHRLARPELAGTASGFVQYYYKFDFSYDNLPHFPNFRLGPVDGSACDTLGLDNHPLAGWRYDKTGSLDVDFTSVSWYEPTAWLWDFDDPASGAANQSAERNPAHTFSAPGAYEVCLTVSNAYGADTKCKTVWVGTVGSGSPQEVGDGVKVWPNPTTGEIYWEGLPEGERANVRVYNMLGILQLSGAQLEGNLDMSSLSDGVYWVQFLAPGGQIWGLKCVQLFKE